MATKKRPKKLKEPEQAAVVPLSEWNERMLATDAATPASSKELVLSDPSVRDLTVARDPFDVMKEAKRAADVLVDVLRKKKNPVMMNGEQYLEFEDWMLIARFYNITAKVVETRPVEIGLACGFEARAVAYHIPTGQEISAADAMCLNDEERWSTRPKYRGGQKVGDVAVPMFQLRSMAQTRSCSKVLRNVLSWVVVLAGYKPTPAEELTGDEQRREAIPPGTTLESSVAQSQTRAKKKFPQTEDHIKLKRMIKAHLENAGGQETATEEDILQHLTAYETFQAKDPKTRQPIWLDKEKRVPKMVPASDGVTSYDEMSPNLAKRAVGKFEEWLRGGNDDVRTQGGN